ncbi:MAG: universal stress protein [Saprospiraceae bacterium]|nr:universal stress protein [Candidatus Vicinibacter affinis]
MYKVILCPYDQSENAGRALEHAAGLADYHKAKLIVLSVFDDPFKFEGGSYLLNNNVLAVDLMSKMKIELETEMVKIVSNLKGLHTQLDVELLNLDANDIGESILDTAKTRNVDLIVMGSHGRKGIKRLVMGSVAEYVFRNSSCPVTIVK